MPSAFHLGFCLAGLISLTATGCAPLIWTSHQQEIQIGNGFHRDRLHLGPWQGRLQVLLLLDEAKPDERVISVEQVAPQAPQEVNLPSPANPSLPMTGAAPDVAQDPVGRPLGLDGQHAPLHIYLATRCSLAEQRGLPVAPVCEAAKERPRRDSIVFLDLGRRPD